MSSSEILIYVVCIGWKHKYRDRMFADPFILKETDDTLEILAEEALFLGERQLW